MNSEACLGGEIAAVLLTCAGSGMLSTVLPSLSCKNFQSPFVLPGYLFSRNLQKLPSCLGKAPLGELSGWHCQGIQKRFWGGKEGKELRRTGWIQTHKHTQTHTYIGWSHWSLLQEFMGSCDYSNTRVSMGIPQSPLQWAGQPHLLADERKQSWIISRFIQVCCSPQLIPYQQCCPKSLQPPLDTASPPGKQQPMQSWVFSCPKQPPMQIPGGGTPMPLAPGKHRMVGPCLVPHSLAGDAESQSGDEPWWPLFWPYGYMNLV